MIVPPTKDVLAIMVAILAEPASNRPTTLAAPTFSWVLAVIVPPIKLVFATTTAILAEPASNRPTTLAEPTFNWVLAVIVPPTNDVLAIIVSILAEPASNKPTTLAVAAFKAPLAVSVVAYVVIVCASGVMIHVFDVKFATLVLPPTTKLFASVVFPLRKVLFAT